MDRGEDSHGVCKLVMGLVESGRALCLMGNHEYNLVGWSRGTEKPKHSNQQTIADVRARVEEWSGILCFLGELPIALELPDLRVIHAMWHQECIGLVTPSLGVPSKPLRAGETTIEWLRRHVILGSPFTSSGVRSELPMDSFQGGDPPHEILMKGTEKTVSEPFLDINGKERHRVRLTWWLEPDFQPARTTVFGHYSNLPPIAGQHDVPAPPEPTGHPKLREWQTRLAPLVKSLGLQQLDPAQQAICVDYNGVAAGNAGSCVGAYRWPEHQVAWARGQDRPMQLLAMARKIASDNPKFQTALGPGDGNRATNEFLSVLQREARDKFGGEFCERKICGASSFAVDFFFPEEATIVEVAFGLPNPASEFEKDILKAIMAREQGHDVRRLFFISRPGAVKKCLQPGRMSMKRWAREQHRLTVEVHELLGEPRRRRSRSA